MADFNSTLIRGNLRITEETYGTKFHSDASASTDLTIIPNSSGVALETGNGDGNVSAWVWREKWDAANFGIFHNNSNNILYFVGDNTARLAVGLGSSDPHVYVSSNLYTSGSVYEGGTSLSNKYLGINSNAVSASVPYGFSSRGTSDWSGVSGTMITDWQSSNAGDVMFKEDSGKINVITDGRFYQGIDIYGSSQRVLDTYDLSHTQWGDAYTVDGEHPSAFLHLTGGTMSGDITLGSGASGQTQVGANIIMGIQNDSYGLLPYSDNWNQIGASGRRWYRSYITNMYSNLVSTQKSEVANVHSDTYYASNLCRHFYGGTPTEFVIKTKIKYVSGTHMPIIRIYGYAYGEQSPIELRIGFYIYGGELGWAGAVSTGAWKPEVYLFSYTADSEKWVAVGLKGSCYFCGFQVDTQVGASGAFGSDFQLDGWTTEHNGADTTQSIIPAVGSNDCVAVSYRTMKTDISGSATYASSAGDADTLDGHDSSYFINTSNISSQNVYSSAYSAQANYALDSDKLDGYEASDFLLKSGGDMTGTPYINMPASAAAISDNQPFGITYGRIQGYGTINIAADTDGSTSEYVIITAGYGFANATAANGLAIGYNSLQWKGTDIALTSNFTGTTSGGNWTSITINGTTAAIPQGGGGSSGVSSFGGATGAISLGSGFSMSGNTLQGAFLSTASGGTVNGDVTVTGGSNSVTFTIGGNYSKGTLRIWDGADGSYIDLKADTTFNNQTLFIPNEGDEHTIATQEWVSDRGYITGIDYSMVVNALGYTPPTTDHTYNFAGIYFESGNSGNGDHDCNAITYNSHNYYYSNGPSGLGESTTDGALYTQAYSSDWVGQIAQDYRNGRLFVRGKNSGTWQAWKRIAQYEEIPTNNNQLANGAGYITGITSSMVTTALGYTPGTSNFTGYTASNKLSTDYIQNDAGYITSSGSCASATTATTATKIDYTTTAPGQHNLGGLKVVVLTSEPAEYKQGYIYFIVGS